MARRRFLILLMTVTFLLSAWSNVITAGFCPRYVSNREAETHERFQPAGEQTSCHHEMAEMEMGDPQGAVSERDAETASQPTLDNPDEPCGHCWVHSQPSSLTSTIAAPVASTQLDDAGAPPANADTAKSFIYRKSITPLDHGPPGKSLARHVLLNVFRI